MLNRNNKGLTLLEVLIVVFIIALLSSISIPNLMRAKMNSNDTIAKMTLRSFSTAAESFATANGAYPTAITSLTGAMPAYLNTNKDYCGWIQPISTGVFAYHAGTAVSGYAYTCTLLSTGYTFAATPVTINTTGSTTFTISTGGVLTP